MFRIVLLTTLIAVAFGSQSANAGDDVLYAFENGTDGWWTFSNNATVVLTNDTTTAAEKSAGSLKAVYKYGNAGAYLGMGVSTEYGLGKGKWPLYADGFLTLSLKSNVACHVQVELRAADNKAFSTGMPFPGGSEWIKYSIPFAEFKSGKESLDLKKTEIQKIVITPAKIDSNEHILWLDNMAICKDALVLPDTAPTFNVSGKVTNASGAPVSEVHVSILEQDGLTPAEQTTTDAKGSYTLSRKLPSRRFLVTPSDGFETREISITLNAQKEGCVALFNTLTLKRGDNESNLALAAAKAVVELHVAGNQLKTADDKVVALQGVCVDSLEWSATGENILHSISLAIEQWNANVIRLPVKEDFWFGRSPYQHDGGQHYRKLIDTAVEAAATRGGYLVLDLHCFGAPTEAYREFWKDAAGHFKNNPAVLFELMNEPHSITWEIWRNGGELGAQKSKDVNAAENKEKITTQVAVGMQALLDTVRAAGAHNIVIAGGLDWGYDLSGILEGFALQDTAEGHGIIYSSHVYPWKSDWNNKFLKVADKHPLFIGEVGCMPTPMPWQNGKTEDPKTWAPDMLGVMQKYHLNWTAFSFHPSCTPNAILDWTYAPTPFWGAFVQEALKGKTFEVKAMR